MTLKHVSYLAGSWSVGDPFKYDAEYRRRDLHNVYGGQWQGGISTSSTHPMIFLFTGETGEQFGYRDGPNADGTFHYTGEGQLGDMTFTRGNKAIRDHAGEGKTLHVFQKTKRSGIVRYLGEHKYVDYEEQEGVPDRNGRPRKAIIFRLAPVRRTAVGGVGGGARLSDRAPVGR